MASSFSFSSDNLDEAMKCSGYFFIMTSIGEKEPSLGEYFVQRTTVSDDLVAAGWVAKNSNFPNANDLEKQKEQGIKLASVSLQQALNQPPSDYKIEVNAYLDIERCLTWTQDVIEYMTNENITKTGTTNVDGRLLKAPKFDPKKPYPFGNFEQMIPQINLGFSEWKRMGSVTPKQLKAELKNLPVMSVENPSVNSLFDDLFEDAEAKKEASELGISVKTLMAFKKRQCQSDWETYQKILLACELDKGQGQSDAMLYKVTKLCDKIACKPSLVEKFKYN